MGGSESEDQSVKVSDQVSPESIPTRKLRWKWGLAILFAGIGFTIYQWFQLAPDRTYQVFAVYGGIRNIFIGLLIWWMLISGISWKVRFKGLLGTILFFVLFFSLLRVESFEGDMVPRFQFRFLPTAEQRAEKYFEQAAKMPQESNADSSTLEVSSEDWPAYRGSERDGIVRDQKIRTDWDVQPPKLLWKHPVGSGWGSFAIIGDRAFTQEQRGEKETVVCYDALSGKQIWNHHDDVRFTEVLGGPGPRATPTFYDGMIYSMGATGILNCLNAVTGELVWSKSLLEENDLNNLQWAMSGSPLVWEDLVIVNQGIPQETSESKPQSVIALDRLTGEEVWSSGSHKSSYSSPQLSLLNEEPQLLIFHSKGLEGFTPQEGKSLWFFPWTNQAGVNAAQPIVIGPSSIFLGAGYGAGSARITISESKQNVEPEVVEDWKSKSLKLKFNSAVVRDGFVYGLDEGILTCLNLETGKRAWKRGRYGYGQMILVNDNLLILAEDGRVELVKADPEKYTQIATFQAIQGQTWNHPALAQGKLFVRNSEEAACYDISDAAK
ncbi:PQQ-binding-like beta-propeller repeat protein [Gimesia aquarii]|uniref:Outer membrane protein assembly factor BamB n=1 Tax=Gimesia aquarii TaxID=2527964 RepID=A0A517W0M6_9PLAN|nr:PQQ-binding-like beta-propeller repeat protein [Gimesia aquarii]QDT98808.1 Outer membrane protein assembly factor BamB precursor [Gimesia aquarii]